MSLSMKFDLAGLNAWVDDLQDDVRQAVRPAAQAGAQVLYDEVKRNVARLGRQTGNLERAIYQVHSKDGSTPGRVETYHISWNAKKAPHGHLVEYGHQRLYVTFVDKRTGRWVTQKKKRLATPEMVRPKPFVRPAMAAFPRAIEAVKQELFTRLQNFR